MHMHLRLEQSQPDKLCSSILEIDPKVRYAAVFARHGEFVCEHIHEGPSPGGGAFHETYFSKLFESKIDPYELENIANLIGLRYRFRGWGSVI